MKYLTYIFLFLIISCGNAARQQSKLSVDDHHEADCAELEMNLVKHFVELDSISQLNDVSSTKELNLNRVNEKIFSSFSQIAKSGKLPFCKMNSTVPIYITVSADKKLSVFSWDSKLGGTNSVYASCAVYTTTNGYKTIKLNSFSDSNLQDITAYYTDIYTINKDSTDIYLLYGGGISATLSPFRILSAIELDTAIHQSSIFPNRKSEIIFDYDFTNLNPDNFADTVVDIRFSEGNHRLEFPILKHGRATGKYKQLLFDGTLFVE